MKRNLYGMLLATVMAGALALASGTTSLANETETEVDVTIEEGYTEDCDGYTTVVSWCQNGDLNIYGEFCYPEDFDESQTYPVIVMSHGLSGTHEAFIKNEFVSYVTQMGYVAYIFDYCGGSINSKSDSDFYHMSVLTEKSDLNAIMDFVEGQPFCDTENVFLLGQSQGGFVAALVAAERGEELAGLILIYPAFTLVDNVRALYDSIEDIPDEETLDLGVATLGRIYAVDAFDIDVIESISGYTGDVLLIHGMNDMTVPYTASLEAIATAYADSESELLLIGGAMSVHGFDVFQEDKRACALSAIENFLTRHLNAE